MAEVATVAPALSAITSAKFTRPLRSSAGVKVQLPFGVAVIEPSAGSTLILCTLRLSPTSTSLALASNCAAVIV
ncbi:hypothetical protein D3C87_1590960 [compost metagenome]